MTTIRRPTGPMSPALQAEVQQAQQTQQTQAKAKLDASTAAPELSGAYQALNAANVSPPTPPLVAMQQAMTSGADAFAQQLSEMGKGRASSEEMMLAFLKLQILDSSRGNRLQMLFGAGRSALFSGDLAAQTGKDARAAQASQATTEANNLEATADNEAQQGHDIVSKAGVSTAEVEALVEQSVKAGKNGSDVVDRYAAAHEGEEGLDKKLDALREAQPYYESAGAKYEKAEELYEFASNTSGGWMMGAATTLMTRAGTQGMQALLANADAQRELLNQLMALLAGIRPDAKAKEEAIIEMDKARNEIAKLTLDYIDTHAEAKGGRMQTVRL